MDSGRGRLLIAGLTTRALAASAARAGYRVTAVDGFGDLDLRAVAEVIALTRATGGFVPAEAARAARGVAADLVAYTSNFENHPDAVALLSAGRELLGNPPEVLRRVRRPVALMQALARRGFPVPRTRATAPPAGSDTAWLLKPRRSGGGRGVGPWRGTGPVPRAAYLQERIRGLAGSVIFLADGRRARVLGLSRQLVGLPGLGARRFGYCGSLLGGGLAPLFPREPELRAGAEALAAAVTEEYGLVGLNGLDFIARDGIPFPIEVNPRVSASMELVERAGGPPLFPLHLAACRGHLAPVGPPQGRRRILGKAVLFARRAVVAGDLRRNGSTADLPHPGERIGRGHPICTIFAGGRSPEGCTQALAARAWEIYAALEPRAGAA